MDLATGGAPRSFSDRVLRLLERVEHRVAKAPAEREAAFRLRSEAYQKNGVLQRSDGDRLYDPRYDDAPNAWITTTFIDGELAGTVRVNLGVDEYAILPGLQVFSDILGPKLVARQVIADFAIGTPRAEHMAFYRRTFGATPWCPPRDYPGVTAKIACVGADYRFGRIMIESRYPFYKSEPSEREALFGPGRCPSSGAVGRSRAEDLSAELANLG